MNCKTFVSQARASRFFRTTFQLRFGYSRPSFFQLRLEHTILLPDSILSDKRFLQLSEIPRRVMAPSHSTEPLVCIYCEVRFPHCFLIPTYVLNSILFKQEPV